MYMPTPPDAIGVASEHNQLVAGILAMKSKSFPWIILVLLLWPESNMHVFAIVDIPVDKNKMAFLSTIRI